MKDIIGKFVNGKFVVAGACLVLTFMFGHQISPDMQAEVAGLVTSVYLFGQSVVDLFEHRAKSALAVAMQAPSSLADIVARFEALERSVAALSAAPSVPLPATVPDRPASVPSIPIPITVPSAPDQEKS